MPRSGSQWLAGHKQDFDPFLQEDGGWVGNYFDNPDQINVKRKLPFKNMTRATDSA